ncbi:MAG: PrsW family intramembrane metalloprotease [Bacteroidia bacterium]|jgi:RsiW-degrading membrane proteinase PrsW (M82 family)|nr:PrsW family intramembrane metalloprotease [Bacteroidia bacterium]
MLFFVLILCWLGFTTLWLLNVKLRRDRVLGRRWYDFGDFQVLVYALFVMAACFGLFTFWQPAHHFENSSAQIAYGEKTRQPALITNALWSRIAREPDNVRLHYDLVKYHFAQAANAELPQRRRAFELEEVRLFDLYSGWARNDSNRHRADMGNLFLGWYYLLHTAADHNMAALHLRQVERTDMPFVNLAVGRMLFDGLDGSAAVPHLLEEIKLRGGVPDATALLAQCYAEENDTAQLAKLVNTPASAGYVDDELRYEVYYQSGQVWAFYRLHFAHFGTTLSLWGVAGGLLILWVWLFFLRRLGHTQPLSWPALAGAAGAGALLAMASWWGYAVLHYTFRFRLSGDPWHDLLYCLGGIGFLEELVKLIPFLLILRFTKLIRRPVDYLLVASATGLGFAFFENLLYVSRYGLDVLHARAITASVAHMIAGATAAYGFVLAHNRFNRRWWLVPLFFLLAAFSHGFYDYWLLQREMPALSIFTLLFFLVQIQLYSFFLNNALNQTAQPHDPPFRNQRLAAFLAGALVLVFVLEYVSVTLVYGSEQGTHTVKTAFLSGGFLVFFLSVHLSNILVVPGAWYPVSVLLSFVPAAGAQSRAAALPVDPFLPGTLSFTNETAQPHEINVRVVRFHSRQHINDHIELHPDHSEHSLLQPMFITPPDENGNTRLLLHSEQQIAQPAEFHQSHG